MKLFFFVDMILSVQHILNMAPDPATAERGRMLASTRHWSALNGNEKVLWGVCKGSGKKNYTSIVDLTNIAFKCNCPSRKFPCKHALGLLLLYIEQSDAFTINYDLPESVEQWINNRTEKHSENKQPTDPDQQAEKAARKQKNTDKRFQAMEAGYQDLETWLFDLVRQGMASSEREGLDFWNTIAARMTDMKLGGIGRRIRKMGRSQQGDIEWPATLLSEIGNLYLATQAFKKTDDLSESLRQDLLQLSGVNVKKDELLQEGGIADNWLVMGQEESKEEHLMVRRVWLQGLEKHKAALLLDFVHQSMDFPDRWVVGQVFRAKIVYYPGAFPLRGLVKERQAVQLEKIGPAAYDDIESLVKRYAAALNKNPWLEQFPAFIFPLRPVLKDRQLLLVDQKDRCIPVFGRADITWQILAATEGQSFGAFGEWNGHHFNVLTLFVNGRLITF